MALAWCGSVRTPAEACTARAAQSAHVATRATTTGGARDLQRRREAAVALERQGFHLDWRLASWTDLHDWTLRAGEARLLREYYGVVVDWRAHALSELKEWEDRAARAASLRRLGVEVDWRLFTAAQIDELRVYLEGTRAPTPGTSLGASENVIDRVTLSFDPDGTLLPAFVSEELSRVDTDDAVLEPGFAERRHHAARTRRAPTRKRSGGRGHGMAAASAPAAAKHDHGAKARLSSSPPSAPLPDATPAAPR